MEPTDAGEMTVEVWGDNMVARVPPGTFQGFREHLAQVGIRATQQNRLLVKFIEFWRQTFVLRERKRLVRLRQAPLEEAETDDDDPDLAVGPRAPGKPRGPGTDKPPPPPRDLPGPGKTQEELDMEEAIRQSLATLSRGRYGQKKQDKDKTQEEKDLEEE